MAYRYMMTNIYDVIIMVMILYKFIIHIPVGEYVAWNGDDFISIIHIPVGEYVAWNGDGLMGRLISLIQDGAQTSSNPSNHQSETINIIYIYIY